MPKRRIFVSGPIRAQLTPGEQSLYQAMLDLIKGEDEFEIQEFMVSGLPAAKGWSFQAVEDVMRRCVGAVVVALPRWLGRPPWAPAEPPTPVSGEFFNYEGAVALTLGLPTLILTTQGVSDRGIVHKGGGKVICSIPAEIPENAGEQWLLQTEVFKIQFKEWRKQIKSRSDIFLGYSSGAQSTANAINLYLKSLNVSVLDWRDFTAAGTILEEIEQAAARCTAGVFLFTEDDKLALAPMPTYGDTHATQAAPRDNVVFESGYFASAKGRERTLIIREKQTKMPADVGGNIYLPLPDRHIITSIHSALRNFVEDRL